MCVCVQTERNRKYILIFTVSCCKYCVTLVLHPIMGVPVVTFSVMTQGPLVNGFFMCIK